MHTNKRLDHLTAHRYWRKVARTDDGSCWLWQGRRDKSGYGRWAKQGMHVYVHRIAWILSKGEIPAGMDVLHRCDVRNCCNPEHLFLGTHQDNMDDMIAKKRHTFGAKNKHAKLTPAQVLVIRAEYRRWPGRGRYGSSNAKELAARYGVCIGAICAITRGASWKHVQSQPTGDMSRE